MGESSEEDIARLLESDSRVMIASLSAAVMSRKAFQKARTGNCSYGQHGQSKWTSLVSTVQADGGGVMVWSGMVFVFWPNIKPIDTSWASYVYHSLLSKCVPLQLMIMHCHQVSQSTLLEHDSWSVQCASIKKKHLGCAAMGDSHHNCVSGLNP